ncbi:MAG TPA: GGDEF domain-containing protein [Terracidiphilus sp.]|nr:GGDEF domain-containing protein [Terracidiphilus sp.]
MINTVFQSHGFAISYLLWTSWALLATFACIWRALHCPDSIRTHWRLAAASLLFIFAAGVVEAPEEIFSKAVPTVASVGDFFFFSAFVPILLSISLPDEGVFDRFTFLLDSLQAAACSYLAYMVLMGVFPFTGNPAQAMPYAPLEYVYDTEYVVVGVLAALRFFLGTRNATDRYFFRFLLLYSALYAVTSGIYNHYVGKYSLTNGMDALNDIPSATLALAAIFAPATVPLAVRDPSRRESRPTLVQLIDNARPVFLSLALIGLSAIVATRHFAVAFAFIFGAFILYSLRASMLQSRVEQAQVALEESNSQLSEIALLDSLTGVSNRRSFDQLFAIEWGRAQRTRQPLSLLLVDLDHFKRINDTHGHQAGDECLRNTARVLSTALDRPADLIARYGGDEFAILLPETGSYGASTVAGRIRSAITNDAARVPIPATVSIGFSTWNAEGEASPDQLIRAADRALYAAKQNGRDQTDFVDLNSLSVE